MPTITRGQLTLTPTEHAVAPSGRIRHKVTEGKAVFEGSDGWYYTLGDSSSSYPSDLAPLDPVGKVGKTSAWAWENQDWKIVVI